MTAQFKTFENFSFSPKLNQAIAELDYTKPTPIQQESIPYLLAGEDLIGQAQTGTGKTAAFALPLLSAINKANKEAQALILAPTRELALQIAKAIKDFSKYLPSVKVACIYGGDSYRNQIRDLRDGAQIIVSTPGRMMDHMRRQTVNFETIEKVVLDEADEMLRMGFIDDVEWILEQLPNRNHTALFSATMPKPIRNIALKYLKNPKEIIIKSDTKQTDQITQKFIVSPNKNKFYNLARILEVENTEGIIIFAKTKAYTEEIADKLAKLNFSVAALNGDMPQALRKKTIDKVKSGDIRILVATDVAARGIDIEKISHVINYDAPHDIETYIHRIGRTGRAGRSGTAILFLTPSEMRMLRDIEYKTKKSIEEMAIPTNKELNAIKTDKFKKKVVSTINTLSTTDNKGIIKELDIFNTMLAELQQENDLAIEDIATALVYLQHMTCPILFKHQEGADDHQPRENSAKDRKDKKRDRDRSKKSHSHGDNRGERRSRDSREFKSSREPRESREFRGSRDSRNSRGSRDSSSAGKSRDARVSPWEFKESRDSRDRDSRGSRDFKQSRDSRDSRDARGSRDFKQSRERSDSRDFRDTRNSSEKSRNFRDGNKNSRPNNKSKDRNFKKNRDF